MVVPTKCDRVYLRQFGGGGGQDHQNRNGNSDKGHANMRISQTSYRDMPQRKSKFESELQQNPTEVRSLTYIYRCNTLSAITLRVIKFLTEKIIRES
jgi:hypothetical protein